MRAYTNSSVVEHHEDGSWTEKSEITHYPASNAQKATAVLGLGAIVLAPLAPLLIVVGLEKADEYRAKRRAKREAKKQSN